MRKSLEQGLGPSVRRIRISEDSRVLHTFGDVRVEWPCYVKWENGSSENLFNFTDIGLKKDEAQMLLLGHKVSIDYVW